MNIKPDMIRLAVMAACATAGQAVAQAPGPTAPGAGGLEEVIVTAQRREQSIKDVPIAVSAISRDVLDQAATTGVAELAARVPSLTMTAFNVAQPRIFIRGIGSIDDGAAQDNSVAVFVDDVYVARGAGQAFDFLDVERVEVLRGPQGTLYGKNAVGGLINVISARPKDDLSWKLQGSYGNYDAIDLRGYLTGPISSSVSGSLAAVIRDRSGYAENVRLNRELEDLQSYGVRGQLLWRLNDDIDVLVSADYNDHSDNGQSRKGEGPFTPPPFGSVTAVQSTTDPRESESPRVTYQDRKVIGGLARIDWRLGAGTFTSLTGYRSSEVNLLDAFTGIGSPPYAVLDTANIEDEDADQFSQEFRYAFSGLLSERLSGVTGVYYLDESVDRIETAVLESVIGRQLPTVLGSLTGTSASMQHAKNESFGVFASLSWQFTDTLSATVGGRYTHESKDVRTSVRSIEDIDDIIAAPPTEEYSIAADDSWSDFSPRYSVQWQPNDAVSLYASYSTGFKSGGFQGQAPTGAAASTPFDPETAKNLELGLKGYFLDRKLSANIAIFDTKYEDMQVRQNATRPGETIPIIRITNAGEAKAEGVEVELFAQPVEWLNFWANYGYLDSEYVELIDNTGANRAGNPLMFAPKNTVNAGARLDRPVSDGWNFTARAEYRWQDEFFFDPSANLVNRQPSYGLWDASVGMRTRDERLSVELWGKNLNDELYRTHVIPFLGDRFAVYGPPRTYGLRLTWSMD
jgi:iron complex outermembrane recepter protein